MHGRGGSRILQERVSNPAETGTKDAETETPKASTGWGMGRGYPPSQPTRMVWRSVVSSLSGVRGGAPAENEFGAFQF